MEDLSARLSSSFPIRKCSPQLGELAAGLAWASRRPAAGTGRGSPRHSGISPPFWGCWRHRRQYPVPGFDPALLGRIAQVMSSFLPRTAIPSFLMAFAALLREHRRKEEAAQLLRIIRLLPLLEDKPPPVKAAGAFFIPAAFAW